MGKRIDRSARLLWILSGILSIIFLLLLLFSLYDSSAWTTCCQYPTKDVCESWRAENCEKNMQLYGQDGVPDEICNEYNDLMGMQGECNHSEMARICMCNEPFGSGK